MNAANNDDLDDWLDGLFDPAQSAASTSGPAETDKLVASLSEEDRRSLDETCRKIIELFEELAEAPQGDAPPKSEPTAHQVIYNWISGRPT